MAFCREKNQKLLFKVDSLLKFRKCTKLRITASFAPHALKGQKLLAQGNALGYYGRKPSPCKGKSFKTPGNL